VTARSIGELLAGLEPAKATRSFQPVRRNSYYASDRRSTSLWRPIAPDSRQARRLIAARLKAAEYYNERNKQAGDRQGPLGDVGIRLLRELYRIVDFRTGRLEPAIDTLCERINRARATVVKYLAKLKEHGFLDWVRRSEPIDDANGAGPRVRQITNAYGFGLPASAATWVKKILGNGPAPDCELAHREADRAEVEAMLETVSNDDAIDFLIDAEANPQLSEIFKRMGATLSKTSASSNNSQKPNSGRL
jgi:hypothetical protein